MLNYKYTVIYKIKSVTDLINKEKINVADGKLVLVSKVLDM